MDAAHDLFAALDDGLAVVSEWDGGTIEEKLRAVGLDPADVRRLLEERWEAFAESGDYRRIFSDPDLHDVAVALFAAAMAEGLLAGTTLERSKHV